MPKTTVREIVEQERANGIDDKVTAGERLLEGRAKRTCSRCPVRAECLTDAYQAESASQIVIRNMGRDRDAAQSRERVLPCGVWGGTTPAERWADDVVRDSDKRCAGTHKRWGCRPIADRIEILDHRLREQARTFLSRTESVL